MNITFTMDSLYSQIAKKDNSYISPNKQEKKILQANTDVQDMCDDISDLRNRLRKLRSYDEELTGQTKLEKQLKKFTESYNSLKEQYEEMDCDKNIKKQMTKLDNLIDEHKNKLEKIGIKNKNGKLNFDSEKFNDAKSKEICKVMVGTDCFMENANKILRKLEKEAQKTEFSQVSRKYATITRYSEDEMKLAASSNYLKSSIDRVQYLTESVVNGTATDVEKEEINGYGNIFTTYYNQIVMNPIIEENEKNSDYVGHMKNLISSNKDKLNAIGISLLDNNTLQYDDNYFNTIDENILSETIKNAYDALFGKNASYGNLMKTYATELFKEIMKTESLGITINEAI